jgi:thiol-disulfide isomerase/thioredoxin
MDFSGNDCNGIYRHLFADLDSGKAVLLHFYMPSCGSCPPPAQKIQAMANNINATHPGKVKAYAFPFNNTTTCTYSSFWVSSNGLSLYAPMDSGATMVAYYGGFGMPTVVLLGGTNHRVMFSTQSFVTSDTTVMRDSILAMLATGINEMPTDVSSFNIYPNPASDVISIDLELKESSTVYIEITDVFGKQIAILMNEKQNSGQLKKQFSTAMLPKGNYLFHSIINGRSFSKKLTIIR